MSIYDEIKQKLDIVDVISESVHLQKAGQNFKALCPFHPEKTPSFIVSPQRQTWHCFGACATGGDVFAFVMKKDNLEFGEALRLLAQKAGVTLSPPSAEHKAAEERREKLYQATEAASQFYQRQLLHPTYGATARRYFEERGLTTQTIQDFGLGFNPAVSPGLCAHLLGRGYPRGDLIAAGLIMEAEGGELRDRFPGRLIFPIRNAEGRACGFGTRSLDGSMPKYINTPQTDIFDKGGLLYGLDRAKVSIRRLNQAIIVEGYMDVLMAHQYGFAKVVASMGTSLTEKQVGLLKRFTKNIILALDADAAGTEATLRAHDAVIKAEEGKVTPLITPRGMIKYENILDTEIKVLVPPEGQDPDEVILKSAAEWQRLVDESQPLIDFILETTASRHDLSQALGKSKAAQEMLPLLAEIKDPIRQAFYRQRLARLLGITEADIDQGLKKIARALIPIPFPKSSEAWQEQKLNIVSPGEKAELHCLALLLQYPELRSPGEKVSIDYFENSQNREIFRAWQQSAGDNNVASRLDTIFHQLLNSLQNWPLPPAIPGKRELELKTVISRLKEVAIRRLWKAKEIAIVGLDELEKDVEVAREMQQIFKERQQRAKLGE